MKKISKIIAAFALSVLVFNTFATQAGAQTQNAEQNANTTVNCSTGSYGTTNCYSVTNQNIDQDMRVYNKVAGLYHKPVDASVNQSAMATTVVTLLSTAGASAVALKSRLQ